MRVDWKRIILEIALQTLVELAPVSLGTVAAFAEYVVQLTHGSTTACIQQVFSGPQQRNEQHLLPLALCKLSAPSLT